MANIKQFSINGTTYDAEDTKARNDISAVDIKVDTISEDLNDYKNEVADKIAELEAKINTAGGAKYIDSASFLLEESGGSEETSTITLKKGVYAWVFEEGSFISAADFGDVVSGIVNMLDADNGDMEVSHTDGHFYMEVYENCEEDNETKIGIAGNTFFNIERDGHYKIHAGVMSNKDTFRTQLSFQLWKVG